MGEYAYSYSYRDNPDVPDFPDDKAVIVFDGHCVLCSRWANFVIKRDHKKRYRLLAAQTDLGEALYHHYGLKTGDYDSNLLIEDGQVHIKSDATLGMIAGLGGLWSVLRVFKLVPRPVRDWVYDRFAQNRMKWFGEREQCFIPPPGAKDRFL